MSKQDFFVKLLSGNGRHCLLTSSKSEQDATTERGRATILTFLRLSIPALGQRDIHGGWVGGITSSSLMCPKYALCGEKF